MPKKAKHQEAAAPTQKPAPAAQASAPDERPAERPQDVSGYDMLEGETCPICNAPKLQLMETTREVPFFGVLHLFSMDCSACNFHKADVEAEEEHEPCKYTLDVNGDEDLKVRVIKSSNATVKIGQIGSIEPGEAANGYITNIEGVLNRMKSQIEHLKRAAEDEEEGDEEHAEQARKHLKKLIKVLMGHEPIKITISDPTGNSAIISEKAERKKL